MRGQSCYATQWLSLAQNKNLQTNVYVGSDAKLIFKALPIEFAEDCLRLSSEFNSCVFSFVWNLGNVAARECAKVAINSYLPKYKK